MATTIVEEEARQSRVARRVSKNLGREAHEALGTPGKARLAYVNRDSELRLLLALGPTSRGNLAETWALPEDSKPVHEAQSSEVVDWGGTSEGSRYMALASEAYASSRDDCNLVARTQKRCQNVHSSERARWSSDVAEPEE